MSGSSLERLLLTQRHRHRRALALRAPPLTDTSQDDEVTSITYRHKLLEDGLGKTDGHLVRQ